MNWQDWSSFLKFPFVCHLEMTGARATAAKPTRKNPNMRGMSFRALAGALANSFQTNTPQIAETIVAPCPMAYEFAGTAQMATPMAKKKATAYGPREFCPVIALVTSG